MCEDDHRATVLRKLDLHRSPNYVGGEAGMVGTNTLAASGMALSAASATSIDQTALTCAPPSHVVTVFYTEARRILHPRSHDAEVADEAQLAKDGL